jgi:hypothetical protein
MKRGRRCAVGWGTDPAQGSDQERDAAFVKKLGQAQSHRIGIRQVDVCGLT